MGFSKFLRKIATGDASESCEIKLTEQYSECNRQNNTTGKNGKNKVNKRVDLMPGVHSIEVIHNGKKVEIKRQQDPEAAINPRFAKVSRPCPPFCIQPMQLAPGIETIGELEMFDFLQQATYDDSILVVDSRIASWFEKGTIPGSSHIPWTSLALTQGVSVREIVEILCSRFNVRLRKGNNCADVSEALQNKTPEAVFDFSEAKTLVLFCNGCWCAQTPESVEALLSFGYPTEKLKYYRDGMQGWESLGLTSIRENATHRDKRNTSCDKLFASVK